jgi:Domain of unknown function (DUF4105)
MTGRMGRVLSRLGLLLLGVILIGIGAWGVMALWYFDEANGVLRAALAAMFALATLAALIALGLPRWRWRTLVAYLALFTVLLLCWAALRPSNNRDWQPEVAVLPYSTIEGNLITVHNIRNFDYRTESEFTRAYYDKTFDLRQLKSVDLIAVYWMGPQIAHIFVSFGFGGADYLAFSIEARKLRNEGFSTVKGFFRQYELYYVVADERDVIRLRTNYRKDPPEEVHIYRVRGTSGNGQRLFLSYMDRINALHKQPEFYNSLTTNCTTNIWLQSRVNPDHLPFSWKILISGHVPEYLYESGMLDTTVPFSELQRRSIVNARAQAADQAADFSQRIRAPAQAGELGR